MNAFILIGFGYMGGIITVICVMVWAGRKVIKSAVLAEQAKLQAQSEEAKLTKERLRQVQRGPRL